MSATIAAASVRNQHYARAEDPVDLEVVVADTGTNCSHKFKIGGGRRFSESGAGGC